ncbi:MAG: hypothetical protein DYH12_02460 [Sorangiineae bacterium PRO1]|nr:hypothetical protein [Sorangiineae bacterium PRO1]
MIRALPLLAALPLLSVAGDHASSHDPDAQAFAAMKASFKPHGQAGMDRLEQDETQRLCSRHAPAQPPHDAALQAMAANRETIKYPADGKFLGDWKRGEAIAQEGTGKQYSDDPAKPSGGNCYACLETPAAVECTDLYCTAACLEFNTCYYNCGS